MSDENVENKDTEIKSDVEEKEEASSEHITLESLANDVAEIKSNYNMKLKEKDDEINNLKENNKKLEKILKEQQSLIGNFREGMLNNAKLPSEAAIQPNEAHLKECYEDAYKTAYQWMKHRLIGKNNDEKLFLNRCMEVNNDKLL